MWECIEHITWGRGCKGLTFAQTGGNWKKDKKFSSSFTFTLWPYQMESVGVSLTFSIRYFGLYGFEKRGIEFPCWGNVGNLWKRARFALNAGLLQIPILKFPQDFFTFNFFPNIIQTQAIDDWFGCSCSSKLWVQRRSEGSMCLSSALCFSSQISYICPVRLQSGLKVVLIPTRSHLSAQPHWVSCSCSQDCFLSRT